MESSPLVTKDDKDQQQHHRSDFSLLMSITEDTEDTATAIDVPFNASDHLEKVRMELNNAIARCVGTPIPSVDGVTAPVVASLSRLKNAARGSGTVRLSSSFINPKLTGSDILPIVGEKEKVVENPLSRMSAKMESGTVVERRKSIRETAHHSANSIPMASPSKESPPSPNNALTTSDSNSNPTSPRSAVSTSLSSIPALTSPSVKAKSEKEKSSFKDKFVGKFGKKKDSTASKIFGISLAKLWEAKPSIPIVVSDCVDELASRGGTVEGIFRVPGSTDAVKSLQKKYDNGETADLSAWDPHTVASVLCFWLRELPECLIPIQSCQALLSVLDEADILKVKAELHALLPKSNLQVLGAVMLCLHGLCEYYETTKMDAENFAVCLTVDLIRDEQSTSLQNLKNATSFGRLVRCLIEHAETLFEKQERAQTAETETKKKVSKRKEAKNAKSSKKQSKVVKPKLIEDMLEENFLGICVANQSHEAQDADELSFSSDEKITIHVVHPSGWWYGQNEKGEKGLFSMSKTNAGGVVRPTGDDIQKTKAKIVEKKSSSPKHKRKMSLVKSPRIEKQEKSSSPRNNEKDKDKEKEKKSPKEAKSTHSPSKSPPSVQMVKSPPQKMHAGSSGKIPVLPKMSNSPNIPPKPVSKPPPPKPPKIMDEEDSAPAKPPKMLDDDSDDDEE